ncbi:MAG TPA: hypothetical protein DCL16_09055, partial [Acidimicrobiaceae bacterium]|nr:hypothetical protein [Acidimicrobiaceae bacterium]
ILANDRFVRLWRVSQHSHCSRHSRDITMVICPEDINHMFATFKFFVMIRDIGNKVRRFAITLN